MKTTSGMLKIVPLILISMVLISCGEKKAKEYEAVKKDMAVLMSNWKITQEKLGVNMSNMMASLKGFSDLQVEMTKLMESKNTKLRLESEIIINESKADLATLEKELSSLNAYIEEWNLKSKSVNELVDLLETKKIEPEAATERIAELRAFKAKSDVKLDRIESLINEYKVKNQKLVAIAKKHRAAKR
jgi:hypothetical protein